MHRLEEIEHAYHAARDLTGDARARFLDDCCGADGDMRRQVEALLAHDAARNDNLLDRPALDLVAEWPSMLERQTDPTSRGVRVYGVGETRADQIVVAAAGFAGTPRFRLVRRLGEGGMGVVYEADDVLQSTRVALKTLRAWSADALLRFKNEFRALAGLHHPNLVTLHQLFEESGHWFFSMELVEGTDFLSFVRQGTRAADSETASPTLGFDERRLRTSLAQLARGVHFLHEHGKIHRDIKPSNIRVTPHGRVVLLDFGLITDAPGEQTFSVSHGLIVGTIAYMAPEQAASQPVGPAADWYAVGVALYEALTGRVPFLGSPLEILVKKQQSAPPPPRALNPFLPKDLDTLCCDLLLFDPNARPSGVRILEQLGITPESVSSAVPPLSTGQKHLFVGRARELQNLRQAFSDSRTTTATVLCEGESGMGKSALVHRFCDEVASSGSSAVILAGRCYEREAVPFKAVDGIVDALSQYLAHLPEAEAAVLLPRYAGALAQAFPVLRRVSVFAAAPLASAPLDGHERRTRVFAALREVLERLAHRRPLVLVIDDLQWGDVDSLTLLQAVLQPPEAPRLLLVATRRGLGEPHGLSGDVRQLEVGSLPPDDAEELARMLCQRVPPRRGIDAMAIATEARGHPLYVEELVRHALEGGAEGIHLDDALAARVARLDARERALLEIVAVAGAPIVNAVAAHAANLTVADLAQSVALLRAENLCTAGSGVTAFIECYHDRVRESVTHGLGSDRARECHRKLALAFESHGDADPEMLATHWQGANDTARAAIFAEQAAAAAVAQLAFDRAVRLLRLAIDLGHRDGIALRPRLADALANAGRGKEAAETYLAAADSAETTDALEYRRRAAEQLLISGHIEPGLKVIRVVLTAIGMRLPETPRAALFTLLAERMRLRLRGCQYTPRREADVPRDELVRVDTCWAVAVSLADVDTLRGAAFQSRSLRLALTAGEPRRVGRALALEAIFQALEKPGSPAVVALQKAAKVEAIRSGEPYLLAWCDAVAAIDAYQIGAFRATLDHADRGCEQFRACPGATLELDNGSAFALWALYYLGRWTEMAHRIPSLVAEAKRRDNLYTVTTLTTGILGATWLASDDLAPAWESVAQAEKLWARQPGWWHIQHYFMWLAASQLELYEGRPCFDRAVRFWPGLERSFLLRIAVVHVEAFHARARAALAEARLVKDKSALLARSARQDAKRFARDKARWAAPAAELILAGADALEGKREAAVAHLDRAIGGFDATEMALFAAVARRRKGELLGGDEGRAHVAHADDVLRGERIKKPDRIAALLAPGFPD